MRFERTVLILLIVGGAAAGAVAYKKITALQAENHALRAQVADLEKSAEAGKAAVQKHESEAEKSKAQTAELIKLRGEVTQLRTTAKSAEVMRAENERLRGELQHVRTMAATVAAQAQTPPSPGGAQEQFPREAWNFAGYATPEATLVSSIWAMKEGNPETYLDSLTPQEQERIAQTWGNKSEEEIAAKHKQDVAEIKNLRILERQNTSPNEVILSVFLDGPGRVEKVRMIQMGQEWKFGGFVRAEQKP